MYCLKCKTVTESCDVSRAKTSNNKIIQKSICTICNSKKCKFISGGKVDIHATIGKLPKPKKGFVLYKHKYTGPYNPLHQQLDEYDRPIPGQEPFNQVDEISRRHDICYRDYPGNKLHCDKIMLKDLKAMKSKNKRERLDKKLVQGIIGAKTKLGLGVESGIVWSDRLADELHKPIRRKFKKRRVMVAKIDDTWAIDLVDMQSFSRFNRGYKYLLAVIDIFSKYGWLIPIKSKTGEATTKAFATILNQRKPHKIWVDKGKEFYNKHFQTLLEKHGIEMYSTENEEKSSVVERWNRTMKRRMFKYFSASNTNNYVDVLSTLLHNYNNSKHRSIKMSPEEASFKKNEAKVYSNLYGDLEPPPKPKYSVGDMVRISKKKGIFEKGYMPNWTEEIFAIYEVQRTNPPTYKIKDTAGKEIKGTFYEQELQKTMQEVFRIEKVIRKRTNKQGKKEVFVKWKGYPASFNSWIPEIDSIKL